MPVNKAAGRRRKGNSWPRCRKTVTHGSFPSDLCAFLGRACGRLTVTSEKGAPSLPTKPAFSGQTSEIQAKGGRKGQVFTLAKGSTSPRYRVGQERHNRGRSRDLNIEKLGHTAGWDTKVNRCLPSRHRVSLSTHSRKSGGMHLATSAYKIMDTRVEKHPSSILRELFQSDDDGSHVTKQPEP